MFGIEMGGGKDEIMNEMMSLDNQSDVLITDEQLSDVLTIHVQVSPLLGTDSVANTISTYDRRGTRERQYSLMLHVDVDVNSEHGQTQSSRTT